MEKQLSKAKKDKKRRDQRLNHELEISTYFGVPQDRQSHRADLIQPRGISDHHLRVQRKPERHLTRHHVRGHRSSSHFQQESSVVFESKKPRTESTSGITWLESLPVGTSASTHEADDEDRQPTKGHHGRPPVRKEPTRDGSQR